MLRARAIFALQRQLLMRARGALFARLASVGGVPTVEDDAEQSSLDARATREMRRALQPVLAEAFVDRALSADDRDYWAARAPALLCFGARQHEALAALVARPGDSATVSRGAEATALFQLAASLLDWIGDERGGGDEVARLLPAGALAPLVTDARARDALRDRAHRASAIGHAFVTTLAALLDRIALAPGDPSRLARLLGAAYDAELASFATGAASPEGRVAMARRKAELPTLVCGALARMGMHDDDGATVERAADAIAPFFGVLDDLADLADDLRRGQLNAIAAQEVTSGSDVERALREVLAGDAIERHAAHAAACVLRVDDIARAGGTSPARRRATMQWLRVRAWQWLS